jgi:hypothetical protein
MRRKHLLRGVHWSALVAVCALIGYASACDLGRSLPRSDILKDVRPGVPSREAVRLVGVVTGYGTVDRAFARLPNTIGNIATLRLRVDDVVSGRVGRGETEIVPFGVVADCSSMGLTTDLVSQRYPVGSTLVVLGEAVLLPGSSLLSVVADAKQGGFAKLAPLDVRRLASGELDFSAATGSVRASGSYWDFELDRALLMLADAPIAERFAKLRNLASYSYHAYRDVDREFYSRLVAANEVTAQQREQLMKTFDAAAGGAQ